MAIASMKKIYILSHAKNTDGIIDFLQEKGILHVKATRDFIEGELPFKGEIEYREDREDYQSTILRIEYLLDFLKKHTPQESLLEKLKRERLHLKKDELRDILLHFPLEEVYKEARDLDSKYQSLKSERQEKAHLYRQLLPWESLDVSCIDLESTKKVELLLLRANLSTYEALEKRLKEDIEEIDINPINQDTKYIYLLCLCLKPTSSKILEIAKDFNTERIFLPHLEGTPAQIIKDICAEEGSITGKIEELYRKGRELLVHQKALMTLYDHYYSQKAKEEIKGNFFYTKKTSLISGWIEEKNEKIIKERLSNQYPEVEVLNLPPQKGEKAPIVLENNKVNRPFEAITGLYGRPAYGGVDPTPYLTPFFALFFGLCLTDAVYGIVIILFTWYALKKWKLSSKAMKFFRVFLYGGIASLFCGAITGGWLGDFVNRLPNLFSPLKQARRALIIFDSIENATTFMVLAIILGFIQVLVGVLINLRERYRYKEWKALFFRQLPAIGIQFSLVLIVITTLFKLWTVPAYIVHSLWSIFLISSLSLIYYYWTSQEKIALKLFWCWYGWYGVVTGNSLADILSYIRLFALGLTTALLALSINEISSLMWKIPYIGFVFSILIFIPGHIFNLLINTLGAYVHTSRLQYYEFFMKFFEGGGAIFTPFTRNRKYIEIIE